jgi:hypothetical protein
MIDKITVNAKINTNYKLFYLIKILFNKVNEIIEVVNRLEKEVLKHEIL